MRGALLLGFIAVLFRSASLAQTIQPYNWKNVKISLFLESLETCGEEGEIYTCRRWFILEKYVGSKHRIYVHKCV